MGLPDGGTRVLIFIMALELIALQMALYHQLHNDGRFRVVRVRALTGFTQ